jgi:acetyltransferase-like isoleucine patch superfamily enzyme
MIYTKSIYPALDIGDYTYGEPGIIDLGRAKLTIGKFCAISAGVVIFMGAEHRTDWVSTYPFSDPSVPEWGALQIYGHPTTKGNVTIGNDVWIGSCVTILSGVTVGDGACIGTNAVVARNVLPYCIVAGNPAREIRYRFDAPTINALLAIKWWDWPIEKIRENIKVLMSPPSIDALKALL